MSLFVTNKQIRLLYDTQYNNNNKIIIGRQTRTFHIFPKKTSYDCIMNNIQWATLRQILVNPDNSKSRTFTRFTMQMPGFDYSRQASLLPTSLDADM